MPSSNPLPSNTKKKRQDAEIYDLLIIGGGVNGTAIARDAAGRGLRVVLAEKDDLAVATSSASTKMFHGGLRYLEYLHFKLVRDALEERAILLRNMPHISWPMRFVLPHADDMRFDSKTATSRLLRIIMPWLKGRRPNWLIRLGLFLYDHLGNRGILPPTVTLDLREGMEGKPLQQRFVKGYEYSDCWVDDARLVVLMACDARDRGAHITTRNKVSNAHREDGLWVCHTERGNYYARAIVNVSGAWVDDVARGSLGLQPKVGIRLVKGSHIVVRKLYDHEKCYFFQGQDGRVMFAIPYENDFTLLGTTDQSHDSADQTPVCSTEEVNYICRFASEYFAKSVTPADVVWQFAGVRPLYDDGSSSSTAATREYVIKLDASDAPLLSVYGGKITTHRKLAEGVLEHLRPYFPQMGKDWTQQSALPGGGFTVDGRDTLVTQLQKAFPFLPDGLAYRLMRSYGTRAWLVLGGASTMADLGQAFGGGLTAREVDYLLDYEFARTADDILWRRSKLGLHLKVAGGTVLEDAHHALTDYVMTRFNNT